MKVYQIIRFNLKFRAGGSTLNVSTLGPNLNNTPDASTETIMRWLSDDTCSEVIKRVK